MTILFFIIPAVMSVVIFIFLALDWNDERKRHQFEKDLDMKLSKMDIAKSKIDDLRDSIEKLKETVKQIPVSVVSEPDVVDRYPDGSIDEYSAKDYLERDLSIEDVEFAPEPLSEVVEIQDENKISDFDSTDIDAAFKECLPYVSPTMVKDFKQIFLQRPVDMFRAIEGEQVVIRRYNKNLLRKLVGVSDDYNLTVSGYVDNILHSHFMLYKAEIDSLLSDKDKEDLNRNSYEWD